MYFILGIGTLLLVRYFWRINTKSVGTQTNNTGVDESSQTTFIELTPMSVVESSDEEFDLFCNHFELK